MLKGRTRSRWRTAECGRSGTICVVKSSGVQRAPRFSEDLLRLNAVCPYYTMFPLDFPFAQLAAHGSTTRVLDPFCGRGTTLFAARTVGIPSVGIDVNPVAVAIAQAKVVQVSVAAVVRLAGQILHNGSESTAPEGEFWQLCYDSETLREITTMRAALLNLNSPTAAVLRAIMLGILHGPRNKGVPSYLSNQMPRTYASKPGYAVKFWKARALQPVRVDTLDLITRRAARLLEAQPPSAGGKVYLGDSATVLKSLRSGFDLVVTSPPYYGMRTYLPDQWLRSWFVGGAPEVPYGSVGQIARQPSQAAFVAALADVWRATALRCHPQARLAVRFGALPSARTDPTRLLLDSIEQAASGWVVSEVRPAGRSPNQARQAEQFVKAGSAVDEIDVVAELR
ncbi:DNA methylase N-4/N-6 domain protein [Mycolicibacterium rhodesiae JS60]|nr:DNA methylase N-4/N-6 domain protein [Mycolicibacterium rhodesiae JS60]